jgi:hypothetical protein
MQRLELAGVRRSALVVLAIAFLIPVAVAVWALTQVGGSSSSSNSPAAGGGSATAVTSTQHPKAANDRHSPLFAAVAALNSADTPAKGYLPPSTCRGTSSTLVVCTRPHYAVYGVAFRTYPSLNALYAAYEARVSALSQGPFRPNTGNCTEDDISGEVSWNHNFRHPSIYPVSLFTSGKIRDDQAAGRVFCTFTNGMLDMVWTQDDGRLMGEVTGAPHLDTYLWWKWVHHSIVLPGSANPMSSMPGMANSTSTQPSQSTTSTQTMTSSQSMTSTHSTHSMPSGKNKKSSQSMSGMSK